MFSYSQKQINITDFFLNVFVREHISAPLKKEKKKNALLCLKIMLDLDQSFKQKVK